MPKIVKNLFTRFGDKIKTTKKTSYYLNFPKEDYLTKIYPMPGDDVQFPYKPAEKEVKKYKTAKVIKKLQSSKKSKKKTVKKVEKSENRLRNNQIL